MALKEYNITLRFPDLPLVDVGIPGNPTIFPAEICTIQRGEPHFGKLSANETKQMLLLANRRPAMNAHHISLQGLPKLGLVPPSNTLEEFGISISANMTVIPARELPPPSVTYAKGRPRVNNASWNILDVKFHHGSKVARWGVMVVTDGRPRFNGPNDPDLLKFLRAVKERQL